MKIAILNYTGTVGKTTVAAHLLLPRMQAPIFAIESINETAQGLGIDVEKMDVNKFRSLYSTYFKMHPPTQQKTRIVSPFLGLAVHLEVR